jgi:hypothetical protein
VAQNSSLYARRAGLSLLKGTSALAAIVGARVYPPQRPADPVWPFVAWGVPIVGPFEASCMDGAEIDFALHAYAATEGTGGSTVAGEERAGQIADLAVAALVNAGEVDLTDYGCPYPATAHFTWQQTQVIQDGAEADAFHAIATMRCNVVS